MIAALSHRYQQNISDSVRHNCDHYYMVELMGNVPPQSSSRPKIHALFPGIHTPEGRSVILSHTGGYDLTSLSQGHCISCIDSCALAFP